jgi:hypothetical protein
MSLVECCRIEPSGMPNARGIHYQAFLKRLISPLLRRRI